jgi:hypothetical protein
MAGKRSEKTAETYIAKHSIKNMSKQKPIFFPFRPAIQV